MNKKLNDEQIKEMIELYINNPSERLKLAERFNVLPTIIFKAIKLAKIKFRTMASLTQTEENQITSLYKNGLKAIELVILFTLHPATIATILTRNGISLRDTKERHRQYKCNYSFFSDLNPVSAYWAGFIAGDGNVYIPETKQHKNKENYSPVIKIGLASEDKGHLDKFREVLESNHPIRVIDQSHRNKPPQADFVIASKEIADDLAKNFRILPTKSLNMQWPSHLPVDLQRHFLRGLFDADGCWYVDKNRNPNWHPLLEWSLIGSISAIEKAQDLLAEQCNLPKLKFNKKKPGTKHSTHENIVSIRYRSREHVNKIFRFMYEGATVWLERKRNKVEPYLDFPSEYLFQPSLF